MKSKAILIAASILITSLAAGCSSNSSQNSTNSSSAGAVSSSSATTLAESGNDKENTDESDVSKSESKTEQIAGDPVDSNWFDDAVFIGDSVTLKLSYYCEDHDDLGNAEFLCEGSLGYTNALWELDHEDNVHPVYNGDKVTVDQGVKLINPKKIFIMLGMNDIGLYGVDDAVSSMIELTDKIKKSCPDAVIYIESVTPMVEGNSIGSLNNESIREFDEKLKPVCKEKGYTYLDVSSAVSDENGNLIYEYCGDPPTDDNPDAMGLHFTDTGCAKWAEYLRTHVQ